MPLGFCVGDGYPVPNYITEENGTIWNRPLRYNKES